MLQYTAAKLADLFPHFVCILKSRRNPIQEKKKKNNPKTHRRSTSALEQSTKKFNRGTERKSRHNWKFSQAAQASLLPCPQSWLKVPLRAKFTEAPSSSAQMVFTHYSPPAAFPTPIRRQHWKAKRFPDSVTVFNSYSTRWMTQKMNKQGK